MTFASEVSAAIADGYRDASLAGADMRQVAESFEKFRAAFGRTSDSYRAWRDLDDVVARAFCQEHLPILLKFREQFRKTFLEATLRQVREACADSESGTREYVKAYARAAAAWRREARDTLAGESFTPHESLAAVVAAIRSLNPLAVDHRWIEAYPLFGTLADLDFISPADRSLLYCTAAAIEVYHFKVGSNSDLLLERAALLAPNDDTAVTARGECLLERGDIGGARACAEAALKLDHESVVALVLLSDCAQRQKDFAAAEKWAREAIRVHPGAEPGYRQLIGVAGEAPSSTLLQEVPELVNRALIGDPGAERLMLFAAGYAFQRQAEYEQALKYFRQTRERFPKAVESYTAEAYLLLDQRKRDEARQILDQAAAKFPESPDPCRGLAIIAEIGNDWSAAEGHYRNVISRSARPAPFDRAKPAQMIWKQGRREEGETELLPLLQQFPNDDSVMQIAERLIDSLVDQDQAPAAISFCDRIFAALGDAQRAWHEHKLGDIHYAREEPVEAIERYRTAYDLAPDRPLFALDLARALRKAQRWDLSDWLWDTALPAVQADSAFRREVVLLRNAEANSLYSAAKYAQAVALYQAAIDLEQADATVFENLAGAWERNTEVPALERIEKAIEAAQRANELEPGKDQHRTLILRLERVRSRIQIYGDRIVNLLPVVTPIAIEVAHDLIPLVEGETGELHEGAQQLFAKMRFDLLETYGVRIPGIRVRGNTTDLPTGSYLVMLMEVPLVMGTIALDRRLASAAVEKLEQLGISGEAASDPADGSEKSWVWDRDWCTVEDAGIELWDVLDYVVRHLRAILVKNLTDFMGYQETSDLLAQQAEGIRRRIESQPGGVSALVGVLRALLEEQVSIVPIGPICTRVAELLEAGVNRAEIAERVRLLSELRPLLPGNRPDTIFYRAAEDWSQSIREAMYEDGGQVVLAMDPNTCQEALSAVRAEVGTARAALLMEDPKARPLVRSLVELEFPDLAVLTRAELLPGVGERIAGEIRLD